MFNKLCFYIYIVLGIVVFIFSFSRIMLEFDILENFVVTNNILVYLRSLSMFSKIMLVLLVLIILSILSRGFFAYLKDIENK